MSLRHRVQPNLSDQIMYFTHTSWSCWIMLHTVELYFRVVLDGGRIERVASVRLQIPATRLWSRVDVEKAADDEVCIILYKIYFLSTEHYVITITYYYCTFLCVDLDTRKMRTEDMLIFSYSDLNLLSLFQNNQYTSPEKRFLPRQDSDDLGFSPQAGSPKKPTVKVPSMTSRFAVCFPCLLFRCVNLKAWIDCFEMLLNAEVHWHSCDHKLLNQWPNLGVSTCFNPI